MKMLERFNAANKKEFALAIKEDQVCKHATYLMSTIRKQARREHSRLLKKDLDHFNSLPLSEVIRDEVAYCDEVTEALEGLTLAIIQSKAFQDWSLEDFQEECEARKMNSNPAKYYGCSDSNYYGVKR